MQDPLALWQSKVWRWFVGHAQSPYALLWLALVAYADGIFFPVAPEVFLVALMLAHPTHWRRYLPVALCASVLGAASGYAIAHLLFAQFGAPLLEFYGAKRSFMEAQHFIRGHVFWTMLLGNFSPIPDKVFIYAGGFLGVRFVPFIIGYFVGRGARMSVAVYLAGRYGQRALSIIGRYILVFGALLFALLCIYGIVHWHLLGW
ncbi:MAG: DedA family protein [Patescibacteria group bacterium]|nr:DedA family protein [Patescibacteria group bacterium]